MMSELILAQRFTTTMLALMAFFVCVSITRHRLRDSRPPTRGRALLSVASALVFGGLFVHQGSFLLWQTLHNLGNCAESAFLFSDRCVLAAGLLSSPVPVIGYALMIGGLALFASWFLPALVGKLWALAAAASTALLLMIGLLLGRD